MYFTEQLIVSFFKGHSVSVGVAEAPLADFYLVPHLSTCLYHHCVFEEKEDPQVCKERTGDYLERVLDHVQAEYLYWNASAGTDHLVVFAWDQGAEVLGFHSRAKERVAAAIHLTPLGSVRWREDSRKGGSRGQI